MKFKRLLLLAVTGCAWLHLGVYPGASSAPVVAPTTINSVPALYQQLSCHGCHSLENRGGTMGPALDQVGSRLPRRQLEIQLLTPRHRHRNSRMPSYSFLRTTELQTLLEFLQTRLSSPGHNPQLSPSSP